MTATRTDPLAVEFAAKLSYAACIRAEEAKYHRNDMQRFLSGVTVIPGPINYKYFRGWYESTNHDTTSSFTPFEMQKNIEDSNNEELYSIRHLSRKLSERYGAEGSRVQLAQRIGLPKIMLLQEDVNSIVTGTILNSSWSSSQNCQSLCEMVRRLN